MEPTNGVLAGNEAPFAAHLSVLRTLSDFGAVAVPVTELAIILFLVGLGAVAAVQETRARRWDPGFFRGGVAVFKRAVSVETEPREVRAPPGVRARSLGPHEVAFLAPALFGFWRLSLGAAALLACAYVGERRRFLATLAAAGRSVA